jgi:lambda family phage portal protein
MLKVITHEGRRHVVHIADGAEAGAPVPAVNASAYTAASGSHPDMRRWNPVAGSADSDLLPELGTITSRSRDMTRNHGVAHGAQQTEVDNVVGCGLRLSAKPNWRTLGRDRDWAEEWGDNVEALWRDYASSLDFDIAGRINFDGATTLMYRGAWANGDALALPLWKPRANVPAATCFQMIEADRLCNPYCRMDGENLRGGIEVDEFGKPLAYHIRTTHPGDLFSMYGRTTGKWERIEAATAWGRKRVIHVHDAERAGQSRGAPALAAVMRQFKVLGDFTNAELKAAVVNAMVALVTESSMSQEGLVELLGNNPAALANYQANLASRGRGGVDFNAGMIIPLALGEKISSFTPARPVTSFEPFVTTILRHISAGLNFPYELLMKDFSKTNYSSARAALLEAWRFFGGRRKWLSTYWAQPVYELWLEEKINDGTIEAPDFYAKKSAWGAAQWIGDARGWVDPVKEATAVQMRMDMCISTLEEECAMQGKDWKEVLAQIAREREFMKKLGVERAPAAPAAPGKGTADPADGEDDDQEETIPGAPAKEKAHA